MPTRNEYAATAAIAVEALFPSLAEEARDAIVWLIVDLLMSLDAMADAG
jgi:hypothetical protein